MALRAALTRLYLTRLLLMLLLLAGSGFSQAGLSQADISRADISHVDFYRANFSWAGPLALSSQDDAQEQEAEQKQNWAPEVAEQRQDIQRSAEVIKDIKSKEPFIDIQKKRVWDLEKDKDEDEESLSLDPDLAWLGALIKFMAMVIEAALWLLPLLIAFYIYRYREYWLNLLQGKGFGKDPVDIPDTLFGLDIRQESMPDDIEASAMALWRQKQFREAVSLLYRASLAKLFEQYQFDVPPGATEQDCIHQVEQSNLQLATQMTATEDSTKLSEQRVLLDHYAARIERFKLLTQVWISIAYAHRLPDESAFGQICSGWNRAFAEPDKHMLKAG